MNEEYEQGSIGASQNVTASGNTHTASSGGGAGNKKRRTTTKKVKKLSKEDRVGAGEESVGVSLSNEETKRERKSRRAKERAEAASAADAL
jgi:hypothetical protein